MSQIGDKLQENISKIANKDETELNKEHNLSNQGNKNQNNSQNFDEVNKEIRPFKCHFPDCDKDYNNKSRLDIHLRTHVNLKKFYVFYVFFDLKKLQLFFLKNKLIF